MADALAQLNDVMQRSQLTGVPTNEYNAALAAAGFSPDEWYEATLALKNAGFDTDRPSESAILELGPQISEQGYGNMSYSPDFDLVESLTSRGFDPEIAGLGPNEKNYFQQAENNYLKRTGVKYGMQPTATTQLQSGRGMDMGSPSSASGSGWNQRQTVGASDGQMLGAGNANYHSALIKSLRQSSLNPYSSNAGIEMLPNQGMAASDWTPPNSSNAAFSPSILSPRLATDQEVSDWNDYQAYKTNSIGAKTPILSMEEWIAKGRGDGKPTAQAPVYDPYFVSDGA